jgi:hypothetical protein
MTKPGIGPVFVNPIKTMAIFYRAVNCILCDAITNLALLSPNHKQSL